MPYTLSSREQLAKTIRELEIEDLMESESNSDREEDILLLHDLYTKRYLVTQSSNKLLKTYSPEDLMQLSPSNFKQLTRTTHIAFGKLCDLLRGDSIFYNNLRHKQIALEIQRIILVGFEPWVWVMGPGWAGRLAGQAGRLAGQAGRSAGQGRQAGWQGRSGGQGRQVGRQAGRLAGRQGRQVGRQGSQVGRLAGWQGRLVGQAGQAGRAGRSGGQGRQVGRQGRQVGRQGRQVRRAGQAGRSAGRQGRLVGQAGRQAGWQGRLVGQAGRQAGQAGRQPGLGLALLGWVLGRQDRLPSLPAEAHRSSCIEDGLERGRQAGRQAGKGRLAGRQEDR
ncbi:hypothetical protein BY996DRAFT_6492039 [Phakopsora pachyrhizi]|nr:hypothetical protein BY996DRAFT_6492039 [Phakopsora pachyrhizi]